MNQLERLAPQERKLSVAVMGEQEEETLRGGRREVFLPYSRMTQGISLTRELDAFDGEKKIQV
ncbi:hypothetical protein L0Y69_03305 [bacterium]|nr:hypothetical protein [bacterium]